jgi:hypothetical protein
VVKLKENSTLIKLNEEINGIIEEIVEEGESVVKYINNLIISAGAIMTQTVIQPNKRNKNRRNENF